VPFSSSVSQKGIHFRMSLTCFPSKCHPNHALARLAGSGHDSGHARWHTDLAAVLVTVEPPLTAGRASKAHFALLGDAARNGTHLAAAATQPAGSTLRH
jgi:hypothetical protein